MEKELDIDDILSYRSAAECKLQVCGTLAGLSSLLYPANSFCLYSCNCLSRSSIFPLTNL